MWNIPRNFLEVFTDILGKGKYGWIYKGTVQQKGYPVSVAIYNIAGKYSITIFNRSNNFFFLFEA